MSWSAISIGGDDLLRAETGGGESLAQMRSEAERPYFDRDGPPAHGMAARRFGQPLYAGPIQPAILGGRSAPFIRRSAMSSTTPCTRRAWTTQTSGGSTRRTAPGLPRATSATRIFIVEYSADEPPEAVCIEPRRPLSPVSTVEVELEAPDGVELLLAREFVRDDCPGLSTLEQSRWFSTHYFKLRNTGRHDFEDMTVRVYNEDDQRYIPRRDVVSFADADVWAWRVRVRDGAPVKIVVTVR